MLVCWPYDVVFFLVFWSIRRRKLLQHYDAHGGKRVLEELRRELLLPIQTVTIPFAPIYLIYLLFLYLHGKWNEKFEINDDKHGFQWLEARSQDPMVHFTRSRCHLFDRFPPHWRAADICRGGAFDYHGMYQFSSDFNTKSWQNRSVMRDYVRLPIKIGSDSVCSMTVLRWHRMDCEFGIFVRVAWCTRPDSFAALDDKTIQKAQKVPWNILKPEKLSKPFWCALADSEPIASSLTSKTFWLLSRCLALRNRP